ncbi:hypothetical protein B1222_17090 [Paenibacillus larvae subsp. pulvifaciens]|nr:hypothetical protein B1222_17090 [Paenibacillus larvae subsp. pulvifaciens]
MFHEAKRLLSLSSRGAVFLTIWMFWYKIVEGYYFKYSGKKLKKVLTKAFCNHLTQKPLFLQPVINQ